MMDNTIADDDHVLSENELDRETGISSTTRYRGRLGGWFPQFLELSPGRKGNTLGQIRAWKAERRAAAEARAKAVEAQEPRGPGRPRKNSAESSVET